MSAISRLIDLKGALEPHRVYRVAVVMAHDAYTLEALQRGTCEGMLHALLIGPADASADAAEKAGLSPGCYTLHDAADAREAAELGVYLVKHGMADILMKGLVSTEVFLKAVMDKQTGMMLPDGVLSYVAALELPRYPKLLFFSDPAVIPHPNLQQMDAMVHYSLQMARSMGIDEPKVALVSAVEKSSPKFESHGYYAQIKERALEGHYGRCVVDGPLDLFLACSANAARTKQVNTPVAGEADVLIFPNLESSNPFYKGLMLFAGAELGGLIRGTSHPVVVMSRSESAASKYYCVLLACKMCGQTLPR